MVPTQGIGPDHFLYYKYRNFILTIITIFVIMVMPTMAVY